MHFFKNKGLLQGFWMSLDKTHLQRHGVYLQM